MFALSVVPGELTTFQWETTLGQHKPVLKDDKNKRKVWWEGGVDLRRVNIIKICCMELSKN